MKKAVRSETRIVRFFENHGAPNDLNRIFGASSKTVSIGNIFYIQI